MKKSQLSKLLDELEIKIAETNETIENLAYENIQLAAFILSLGYTHEEINVIAVGGVNIVKHNRKQRNLNENNITT